MKYIVVACHIGKSVELQLGQVDLVNNVIVKVIEKSFISMRYKCDHYIVALYM